MATYSLNFKGAGATNPQIPINHVIDDAACNTPTAEQRNMSLGTPFLARMRPGDQEALYVYDAERSIPGVLRVLRRV